MPSLYPDPPPLYSPVGAPSAPPLDAFNGSAPSASDPRTPVTLRVSCNNLLNRDRFSKSDPQLLIYIQQRTPHSTPTFNLNGHDGYQARLDGGWTLLHRSRTQWDDLNPVFPDAVAVDYAFERVQNLCLVVVDVDDEKASPERQDYLGHVVCSLASVVSAGAGGYKASLSLGSVPEGLPRFRAPSWGGGKQQAGSMLIRASTASGDVAKVLMTMEDEGLARSWSGSLNVYVVVSTVDGAGRVAPLLKSECCKAPSRGHGKARWGLRVPVGLAGGLAARLRMSVWDHNTYRADRMLGEWDGSLDEMAARAVDGGQGSMRLALKEKDVKARLGVESFEVVTEETFVDHVARGCEFSLAVAIDFTASNGDPRSPTSLHFMPGLGGAAGGQGRVHGMNEYQRAIVGVGKVLAEYDADQRFPTMGFGFQMAGAAMDCAMLGDAVGIDGILRCYATSLMAPGFKLYGPTLFAPVIRTLTSSIRQELATDRAHTRQRPTKYHILLILTDGQISDMDATRAAIVDAATLPLSIVIVGVGREDFSSMRVLDGDDVRVSDPQSGKVAERDCVQFVAFGEVEGDPFRLAAETLAEIPAQFMDYVKGPSAAATAAATAVVQEMR
ncbi:Copine-5, partial [Irineochytrium annulatum]